MVRQVISVVIFVFAGVISGCDYARFGQDHTMCRYTGKSPNHRGGSVNQNDRNVALRTHNILRQQVATGNQRGQPKASNMQEMQWNDEITRIAQRWADQCTFEHDKNRKTATYSWVGQNLAMTMHQVQDCKPDWNNAVRMWYNEVTNPGFSPNNIEPFKFNSGSGHYTQVVWHESNRLGCGFACCFKQGDRFPWQKIYACNYGKGGNMQGGSMYKRGEPCTACGNGCSTTYNGLCRS